MTKVSRVLLTSLILGGLYVPSASAQSESRERQACERIAHIYSRCEEHFQFDGDRFTFFGTGRPTSVSCTDGRGFEFFDRLEKMDIASIFMVPYQAGPTRLPEARKNWDPGRLRSEELLKSTFGATEAEVRENLVRVRFLNQTIMFQRKLGAASALERVGQELINEAAKDPQLAKFLEPFTSGQVDLRMYTMGWRKVKGTERLSTHSFGTGIDLLTKEKAQYWLWDEAVKDKAKAAQGEVAYRDDHFIPRAAPYFHPTAVRVFEKHGFIWGGKWNHYDTMHFEYRPEFFAGVQIDCRERVVDNSYLNVNPLLTLASSRSHAPGEFSSTFSHACDH